MTINISSNNPLYLTYRNAGPSFALIGPALLMWIIGMFGVLLNSSVIFVTIRTKSLRGTANFLMALICLAEVIHQLGHTVFLAVVISGVNFIDLLTASWLTLPQHFFMSINLCAMFLAALDRLFAISLDGIYQRICLRHKAAYLFVCTSISIVYGVICSSVVIANGNKNPEMPTTGCLAEVLPVTSDLSALWFLLLMTPLSLSAICYLIIGAIIRCNKSVSAKTNMRLLRSLFIILCISIGGYAISFSIYQLLLTVDLGLDAIAIWELSFVAGALLNLCAAANAPVLFVNSTEYRKAYRQLWAAISHGNQAFSTNDGVVGSAAHQRIIFRKTIQPNSNKINSNNFPTHSTTNCSISQQLQARLSILQSADSQ